jgi:hypothetical protein
VAGDNRLVSDDLREWIFAKKGEDGRMLPGDEEDNLDWNRRSKGRCDGLGLGRGEPRNARALLLGVDRIDP